MYCNHCGAPNPDGSAFCSKCGKPIGLSPEESMASTAKQEGRPVEVDVIDNDPPVLFGGTFYADQIAAFDKKVASSKRLMTSAIILLIVGFVLTIALAVAGQWFGILTFLLSFFPSILMILCSSPPPQHLIAGQTENGNMCCPKCGSKKISPSNGANSGEKAKWVCAGCGTEFYAD